MDRTELKSHRISLGLTQGKLAEALGLPLRTYEDLEAGRAELRPIHDRAILKVFHDYSTAQPIPFEGPVALNHQVVDRDGDPIVGETHGTSLKLSFSQAQDEVLSELHKFMRTGFDEKHGIWWARNDDPNYRRFEWWIAPPPASH